MKRGKQIKPSIINSSLHYFYYKNMDLKKYYILTDGITTDTKEINNYQAEPLTIQVKSYDYKYSEINDKKISFIDAKNLYYTHFSMDDVEKALLGVFTNENNNFNYSYKVFIQGTAFENNRNGATSKEFTKQDYLDNGLEFFNRVNCDYEGNSLIDYFVKFYIHIFIRNKLINISEEVLNYTSKLIKDKIEQRIVNKEINKKLEQNKEKKKRKENLDFEFINLFDNEIDKERKKKLTTINKRIKKQKELIENIDRKDKETLKFHKMVYNGLIRKKNKYLKRPKKIVFIK